MNTCYAFECENYRKENGKKNRKVSKYRDKNGDISIEVANCNKWANEIFKRKEDIEKFCIEQIKETALYNHTRKNIHKCIDIDNGKYAKSLLFRAFDKNKFYIPKKKKEGNICIYEDNGIYIFMLTLLKAIEIGKIRQFLDIPDVFYIVRQIKAIGIEYYLCC